jgi:hypothetical protein
MFSNVFDLARQLSNNTCSASASFHRIYRVSLGLSHAKAGPKLSEKYGTTLKVWCLLIGDWNAVIGPCVIGVCDI